MQTKAETYYNLWQRLILVMLIGFLSLSCPAKREIKLVLNIPIDQTKGQDDSLKIDSCADYQSQRRVIALDAIQLAWGGVALLPVNEFDFTYFSIDPYNDVFSSPYEYSAALPLFILHEQYRL